MLVWIQPAMVAVAGQTLTFGDLIASCAETAFSGPATGALKPCEEAMAALVTSAVTTAPVIKAYLPISTNRLL